MLWGLIEAMASREGKGDKLITVSKLDWKESKWRQSQL